MLPSMPMAEREIVVCRNLAELSQKGAELFVRLANDSVQRSGRFTIALSGGSTPKHLYSLLASGEYRERVPWQSVYLFWGDERCVPPDHPESNFHTVQEALLSKIDIPAENIHRMAGEKDPQIAAAEYDYALKRFFQLSSGELPRFDLILLGIGDDGHTASLFPGSHALTEMKRLVVAPYVEKLGAYRLTLTLPVLNNGAADVFLVAGENKAAAVNQVLGSHSNEPAVPAAMVSPLDGRLIWLITQDAVRSLTIGNKFA
jgi:6-phosphogluconolactonase